MVSAVQQQCQFGCRGAVGVFELSEGCIVNSNTRQTLCWQHAGRSRDQGALGTMELIEDLTDGWFSEWWLS